MGCIPLEDPGDLLFINVGLDRWLSYRGRLCCQLGLAVSQVINLLEALLSQIYNLIRA